MKEKCLIFLGAGATKPWGGKTTNELTEEIINEFPYKDKENNNFLETILKFTNENGRNNFEIILSYLEYLFEYFRSREYFAAKGRTWTWTKPADWTLLFSTGIETVIPELIQEFLPNNKGCIYYFQNNKEERLFLKKQHDKFYKSDPAYKVEFVYQSYLWILKIIKKHVIKYSKNITYDENLSTMLKHFEKDYFLRIYCTNYDEIIKRINKEIKNGFDIFDFNNLKYGKFNEKKVDFEDNINCFYNLHGNIKMSLKDNSEMNSNPTYEINKIYYFPENNDGFNLDLAYRPEEIHGDRFFFRTPIISGQQKVYRTMVNPFVTYLRAFEKDITNTKKFIFIGTSFDDYHLFDNVKLLLSLRNNDDIEIQIVTFSNSDDTRFNFEKKVNEIFNSILGDNFGLPLHDYEPLKDINGVIRNHNGSSVKIFYSGFVEYLEKELYKN